MRVVEVLGQLVVKATEAEQAAASSFILNELVEHTEVEQVGEGAKSLAEIWAELGGKFPFTAEKIVDANPTPHFTAPLGTVVALIEHLSSKPNYFKSNRRGVSVYIHNKAWRLVK